MNIQDSFLGNKRASEYIYENNKSRKEKNQEIYKQKLKQKKKQRKKENKKMNNKNNHSNSKEYLLQLLNNESKNNKNNSFKVEYQLLEENENSNDTNISSNNKNKKNNKNNLDINPEMQQVFDLFQKTIENQQKKIDSLTKEKIVQPINQKPQKEKKEEEDSSSENDSIILEEESRKKRKRRMKEKGNQSLAELKSKAPYPEVVEPWDTNAPDPELLIHFKCMPNTVPVPIHWAQNGKYLQSQRGKVRKPYKLPDYIEATGISRLRLIEIPVHITLQQKTRKRMRPKLGRTEIDYQILYDAFFKYQTKKRLTKLGEVYYEGKEVDKRMSKYRPGKLTKQLRAALGISGTTIPPFVQNMQRYGPPPAYPFLKIPGVNIPDDDSSALATPGLWEQPDFRYTKEFIWNFDTDKSHWYHYNKDDMIESENEKDNDEKDIEDMGNDQDDLEISDEEKPDISGLFVKPDNNKKLLNEETKEDKKDIINNEIKNKTEEKEKEKEKVEEEEKKEKETGEKFYKVIEQQTTELKNNELNPIGFKYNIIGNSENKKKDENKDKEENKSNKEKEENNDDEEEEEDIENINKNIFN